MASIYEYIKHNFKGVNLHIVPWILRSTYIAIRCNSWVGHLISSVDCDVTGPLWRHKKLSHAISRSQTPGTCLAQPGVRERNITYFIWWWVFMLLWEIKQCLCDTDELICSPIDISTVGMAYKWVTNSSVYYDVIKWKHFPRYRPFVRGIHRSPVNSPHKGQWRRDLKFSLICSWLNGWVNNREVGDLRRHRARYDVQQWLRVISISCGLEELRIVKSPKWDNRNGTICDSLRFMMTTARFVIKECSSLWPGTICDKKRCNLCLALYNACACACAYIYIYTYVYIYM